MDVKDRNMRNSYTHIDMLPYALFLGNMYLPMFCP